MSSTSTGPTIANFLARVVACRGADNALGYFRECDLHWLTWQEVGDAVSQLADGLRNTGLEPGDCVAHVSENRPEWIITDLALHLTGAVHVPIHISLAGEQIAAQIADCGARLVIVSTSELVEKFVGHLHGAVPIYHYDARIAGFRPAAISNPIPCLGSRPSALDPRPANPRPTCPLSSRLATILYTSGTTGRPRGVMLSHANLAANAAAMVESFGPIRNETRLCILPLSHIYARTCDLYTWVYRGSRLVLGESRETLARDLGLARPTALNAVPYLYERICNHIRGAGGDESAAVQNYFGGQMEMLHCGGAPLAPEIEQWFACRGMPVLLGYGLTESSPVIAASTPLAHRAGSVGKPLANLRLRIAEDGEILVSGPTIMLGYWKDESATSAVLHHGWLDTGDLGELDAEGFLTIRGRKKELIVLSTGKKVIPSRVELLLTSSPHIDQAAVYGDGHTGLAALIVPQPLASRPSDYERASADHCAQQRHAFYEAEIKRCLAAAAHEEQIHRFALVDRPFSIEQGELTAKLSLCREVIAKNFVADLAQCFAEG
ncbi:MAG: long-chain fatty acid--CoA ligase [Pirellulales bacterium]|nr:long-chain fatty acid--CoA ligase [Pirellulales bacterium]